MGKNKELEIKVKINEQVIKSLLNILPIEKEVKESKHAYQDYDTLAKIASIEDKDLRKRLLNFDFGFKKNKSSEG